MSRDVKPIYSNKKVKKSGEKVRSGLYTDDDIRIIENWRASHNHILNSWQSTLRGRSKGKDVVFAQRLKRRSTIFNKLKRESKMALSRMHDVAGCRLIFKNIKELEEYRKDFHKNRRSKHVRRSSDRYDYIKHPANSGYRGVHEVYEYLTDKRRPSDWNGLLVEVQYRTIFQHAWATAVEVAGSLTGNYAKFNHGSKDNIEFFRLASEIIARVYENSNSCKSEMSDQQLVDAFNRLESKIKLLRALEGIKAANKNISIKGFNVILKFEEVKGVPVIKIEAFDTRPQATKRYFELEKEYADKNIDIVFVRSDSEANIKNAFRNYFSDTKDFVRLIRDGIERLS